MDSCITSVLSFMYIDLLYKAKYNLIHGDPVLSLPPDVNHHSTKQWNPISSHWILNDVTM